MGASFALHSSPSVLIVHVVLAIYLFDSLGFKPMAHNSGESTILARKNGI
jgi:hypothetical protein